MPNVRKSWPKDLNHTQALMCEAWEKTIGVWSNSTQRIGECLALYLVLNKEDFSVVYAILGNIWSSCDWPFRYRNELRFVLREATRKQLNLMMTESELEEWKKLPDTITAYRFCYHNNMKGFSYSLKKRIAKRFSTYLRYIQEGNDKKYLITASIPKRFSVLKLDRKELEIIATRPEEVVQSATPLRS
jgi:hypothetical protein